MAKGQALSPDTLEAIRQKVVQEVNVGDIATAFDITRQTVHRLARKHGWREHRQTLDYHKTGEVTAILRKAAEVGDKCPTNLEICAELGFKSRATASQAVEKLAKQGLIKVDRFGRDFRQVTFVEDGICTAPPPPHRYGKKKPKKPRNGIKRAFVSGKPMLEPKGTQEPVGCRMIESDVLLDPDWKYCGRKQKPGSSWCPVHHEMCYDKARSLHPDLK